MNLAGMRATSEVLSEAYDEVKHEKMVKDTILDKIRRKGIFQFITLHKMTEREDDLRRDSTPAAESHNQS